MLPQCVGDPPPNSLEPCQQIEALQCEMLRLEKLKVESQKVARHDADFAQFQNDVETLIPKATVAVDELAQLYGQQESAEKYKMIQNCQQTIEESTDQAFRHCFANLADLAAKQDREIQHLKRTPADLLLVADPAPSAAASTNVYQHARESAILPTICAKQSENTNHPVATRPTKRHRADEELFQSTANQDAELDREKRVLDDQTRFGHFTQLQALMRDSGSSE
ncbi:hypothetical protein NLG97_g3627 [Lecanicillium saksenae]|uniref:Uncharacterized protein n=1 Tax=Lecanicillium saksenae TaxID=468837 RepID=A0ACC1QZC9_9HYPO|nr:hypothetical protein NLG97_g3627 [Lecanicillium saksenae]